MIFYDWSKNIEIFDPEIFGTMLILTPYMVQKSQGSKISKKKFEIFDPWDFWPWNRRITVSGYSGTDFLFHFFSKMSSKIKTQFFSNKSSQNCSKVKLNFSEIFRIQKEKKSFRNRLLEPNCSCQESKLCISYISNKSEQIKKEKLMFGEAWVRFFLVFSQRQTNMKNTHKTV